MAHQLKNAGRLEEGDVVIIDLTSDDPRYGEVARITGRAGRYRDPENKPVRVHLVDQEPLNLAQLDPVRILV